MKLRSLCLLVAIVSSPSWASGQDRFLGAPQSGSGGPTILPLGSLRAGGGGSAYITPSAAFNFDFNATGGFRLAIFDGRFLTAPLIEAGYCYHAGSARQGEGHYLVAGAGISLGAFGIAGTLVPAYVVGSSRGDLVQGFRAALRLDFYLGIWNVELAYEWRSVRGTDVHTIQLSVAVDFGIAVSYVLSVRDALHRGDQQTHDGQAPTSNGLPRLRTR